jgi:hypothetical protein
VNKAKYFLLLLILSRVVFALQDIVIPEIVNPKVLQIVGNNLFITDGISVYNYSLNDFKLKNRFGQQGQGPGDFIPYNFLMRDIPSIAVTILKDKIFVSSLNKVSVFSNDGAFLEEKKFGKESMAVDVAPFGKNYIGKVLDYKKGRKLGQDVVLYYTFRIYDSELNEIKDICSYPFDNHILKKEKEFYVINDLVYISGKDGISIDVYNQSGDLIQTISKDYQRKKLDRSDKKKVVSWYEEDSFFKKEYKGDERFWKEIREAINKTDFFPDFRSFLIAKDNIYVETYENQNNKTEFLIFNIHGEFIKTINLPLEYQDMFRPYPYTISEDKLYQLVEKNEKYRLFIKKKNEYRMGIPFSDSGSIFILGTLKNANDDQ